MVAISERLAGVTKVLVAGVKPLQLKASSVMFAFGFSEEQVGEILELDQPTVQVLREMTAEQVLKIQTAMDMTPEKRIAASVQAALDVKMRLMQSGDEKTKNSIAGELIDRHLGKPMQTTQTMSTNVNVSTTPKELDERLQKMQRRLQLLTEKRLKLAGSAENIIRIS